MYLYHVLFTLILAQSPCPATGDKLNQMTQTFICLNSHQFNLFDLQRCIGIWMVLLRAIPSHRFQTSILIKYSPIS
jgi:hypothetical protein